MDDLTTGETASGDIHFDFPSRDGNRCGAIAVFAAGSAKRHIGSVGIPAGDQSIFGDESILPNAQERRTHLRSSLRSAGVKDEAWRACALIFGICVDSGGGDSVHGSFLFFIESGRGSVGNGCKVCATDSACVFNRDVLESLYLSVPSVSEVFHTRFAVDGRGVGSSNRRFRYLFADRELGAAVRNVECGNRFLALVVYADGLFCFGGNFEQRTGVIGGREKAAALVAPLFLRGRI